MNGLLRCARNDVFFMKDVILCVDIGTTSLKAALVTAEGGVVSFCSIPIEEPHDRFVACSWYDAFLRAKGELTEKAGADYRLAAIAVSGNGPTVVSESGLTFRWNEDTSGVEGDIPDCARTSLFIPKILSIKKQFPEYYQNFIVPEETIQKEQSYSNINNLI